jgi:hypothetical protein
VRGPAAAPALPSPIALTVTPVELEAATVERFTEGGCALHGTVLDADARTPVGGAQIEIWMGNRSLRRQSDEAGHFVFDGLVPGSRVTLWITASPSFVQERSELAIPVGAATVPARFALLSRSAVPGGGNGGVGVFLSRRAGRTVITGLTAFGPGESAGLEAGDAIVAVGPRDVRELGPGAVDQLLRGKLGSEVQLLIERPGRPPRQVTLRRVSR